MTKKRNLIAVLFGMIVALLAFAFGFTQKNTVQASADENTLATTGNVVGASIRYDDVNSNQSGIRFSYVIDKSVSGITDLSNIQNAGILSNFTSTLTGDLTLQNAKVDTEFYTNGVASTTNKINVGTYNATKKEFIKDENGDDLLLQVYFYNIPLNTDKATEITCRGYLQLKDGALVYSNALSRSIEYVATEAYKAEEYGSDVNKKAFLESCCTFYNVTFETNGGEAVATQNVVSGGTMQDVTTSLNGYQFVAWTKADGTVVDETTPITENTTVYANFKKTVADNTVMDAAEITGVDLEVVGTPTKVVVGDTALDVADYTLDGTTLSVDKAKLAQGKNVIKVYESDYVYTEYTKTVIDYTKSLAFTTLDASHIVGAQYSTAKAGATTFVNETVGDKTGSFVKVAVGGSNLSHLTLKVDSIYDKAVWEKYAGGTLKIDYYTDVAAYNETTVQLLCTGQKPNNDPICPSSATVVANEWRTVEIAVNDIVANWDYFNGTSITSNSWKSVLMYFSQNVSTTSGNVYFGNFTVSPLDTSIPVAFTSLDASHIVGAQNSTAKASATSFVNETVGGKTGSFVKVAVGGDIQSFTLKVGSIYDKSMWEHYAGCTLKIDYYIDIAEYAGTKIQLLSTNRWNAFGAGETSVVVQQWRTIEIEVDDIVANWDYFTAQAITKDYWNGVLLYFPTQFATTPGNVYFGNFTVSSSRVFTSLDASHIVGAQYSTAKAGATSFVNETVGNRTGSFVKVAVGPDLKYLTLKVDSIYDKAVWENYKGYTLKIDYYTDIAAYNGTTVQLLCTGKNGNNPICADSASVVANEWSTVEIAVDDIVNNWDYFTGKTANYDYSITSDTWHGVLMYFSKNVDTTPGYVYFGNFTVSK